MKVLLISDEPVSTTIWRALNSLRPVVTVATCPLAQAGNYPGYPVLVISYRQWQALAPRAQARVAHNLELVCLYATPRGLQGSPSIDSPITLAFADAPDLPEKIAQALAEVARGSALGQLEAIRQGAAWSMQHAYAWTPPVEKPIQNEPPAPQFAPSAVLVTPTKPAGASGIYINDIHVAGNVYQGHHVTIAAEKQPVTLNLNGPAQVSQHSTGDQVNITQVSTSAGSGSKSTGAAGGEVEFEQHAGRDQVNINSVEGGTSAAVKQTAGADQININTLQATGSPSSEGVFCNYCGAPMETGKRVCTQCGRAVEEP